MAGYLGTKAVFLSTTAASVTGNVTIGGDLTVDTNTLYVDSANNFVGIGTSSPNKPLTVFTSAATDSARFTDNTNSELFVKHSSGNLLTLATGSTSQPLAFGQGSTERMRIDSSGRVGIGTSSPSFPLVVYGNGSAMAFQNSSTGSGATDGFYVGNANSTTAYVYNYENDAVIFGTNNAERMRIDSSGNLLVGTTDSLPATNNDANGIALRADGNSQFSRSGAAAARFNRGASDGEIVSFNKDGSTVGSIGTYLGRPYFYGGSGLRMGLNSIVPVNSNGSNSDNDQDLGSSTVRFDDIYATNGTIQTSDEREKQDIRDITEAEARVAQACKGLLKAYRWKDAVAEKGDNARIHFGIIAQDLQAAFAAEGLDAGDYAMFIHTTWWESTEVIPAVEAQEAVYETQTDEDGNEVQVLVSEAVEAQPERTVTHTHETQEEAPQGAVERDRMGVRYPELLAFIIGAM